MYKILIKMPKSRTTYYQDYMVDNDGNGDGSGDNPGSGSGSGNSSGKIVWTSDDLQEVADKVVELNETYGNESLLVVEDISYQIEVLFN
jgi:hypothetical protein